MKKLLVLLVLVVLGVLVFNHFYDDGGQVWFDDFRGMMTYDDDVKQAAVDYVLGGTGEGLSMNGPHIVFLTVSDGENKADVYVGTGDDLLEAMPDFTPGDYYKLDFVTEVFEIDDPDFDEPVDYERSLYGLAFSETTAEAFLAEENVANTLINSDLEIKTGNLEDYTGISDTTFKRSAEIYFFTTESFYFDNSGEIVDLYRGHPIYEEVTAELVLDSAEAAGEYLKDAVKEDGSFVYDYLPKTDSEKDDYNILRHAGTVYSMLELYQVTYDEELKAAAELALSYLVNQIQLCYSAPYGELCVVEDSEVKIGGNGLSLVSLSEYMNFYI